MIDCERDRGDILTAINETTHVSMVDGEVLISGPPMDGSNDWVTCKESLNRILALIELAQLKEATTVFELALWREKMMEESVVDDGNRNRESCHIEVPGPVKDAVIQFFPRKEQNQSVEQPESDQSSEQPESDQSGEQPDSDQSVVQSDSDSSDEEPW
mmetsp:Transcript_31008/g.65619  ORF Transcript_31008/g.65619 Transcript_31008/m.65619 type:complete len:158 (+) Transcript_31008:406-879(+)